MKHRILSGITAIVMTASLSGFTAHAEDTLIQAIPGGMTIEIDKITLTLDELAAMDYTVPVFVNITNNPGFDAAEFGVSVDERCAYEADIKWLTYDDGFSMSNHELTWRTLAGYTNWYKTGSVLKLEVTVPADAQVGDLYNIDYVPSAFKNHIWYSNSTGRNYISLDAVDWSDGYISIVDEHTQPSENRYFIEGRDNWNFTNSYRYFGSTYQLSEPYYDKLMTGLSNKEREKLDDLLSQSWRGSCYGIASTAVLAFHDILKAEEYQEDAQYIHDIDVPLSNDVKSLIHYYYALQKTDACQQMLADAIYNWTEEEKLKVLLTCLEDDSPTLLTYLDYEWGGHAVVAYDVMYGSYAWGTKTYNGKVVLYDSNHSNMEDEYCLFFNSTDWSWVIPGYELSSDTGSFLGIIADDPAVVNYHGYLDGTKTLSTEEYISILSSAPLHTKFTIDPVENNGSPMTAAATGDIKAYASLNGNGDAETHDVCFALPKADCGYTLQLEQEDRLALSMDYENTLLTLDADTAAFAEFDPSGMVRMESSGSDYTMKVVFNEETCNDTWYSLTVEGQNASDACIRYTDGGYLLDASNLRQISVSVHNDESSEILGFTTDCKNVFLYETDDGIAAAADMDGNGSFETVLAESGNLRIGDLTLDSKLSMNDVIALNQNLLAGRSLNTAQTSLADFDGDGVPTPADSLALLKEILK